MPRMHTPTQLAALNGSLQHNTGRYKARINEPKPDVNIGEAPTYFTPEQTAIWNELRKQICYGVLTVSDRILMEMTCRFIDKMRNGTILVGESAQLIQCLSRMGLTPVDRTKLQVPNGSNQKDPFDEFMRHNNANT